MTSKRRKRQNVADEMVVATPMQRTVTGKTDGQKNYIDLVRSNQLTLCNGLYGTGKTYISTGLAIEALRNHRVAKVVISRPEISACGDSQGFYPGSYKEKLEPFMLPILGEMENFATKSEIKRWIELEEIQLMPLSLLRGQNWNYTFTVIDECANLTFDQIFLILTRVGVGSKIVLSGDFNQSDLPERKQGAFKQFFGILEGMEGVGTCHLTKDDIVRSKFVREVIERVDAFKAAAKDASNLPPVRYFESSWQKKER